MVKTSILKSSLQNRAVIRLRYQNETEENYDGIVVQISNELVVLASTDDFEFNGYNILIRDHIKGYRNSKYERCYTQILSGNKQLKRMRPPNWINSIKGIDSAIKAIKRYGIWPAVETLYNSESSFYIGPITSITQEGFKLYCYDAIGKWEKEYQFGYEEVIRVEWASKYCIHFNSYMKAAHNNGLQATRSPCA